ncbi:MAG: FAD-dependent oxidoreductase, partial [Armatimonadota bacterium]|nr:FAD-dependent oxidoreductase [Armatimonadota bacterium]
PGHSSWSDAIDLLIRDVPNLTVYLNTEGTHPVMEGGTRIAAVEAENVITGERFLFRAPLFADCTGDGAIAYAAGCEYRVGQEGRDEFGESYAPERPTRETMGTSLLHRSTRMPDPQPYTPPPFAVKFTAEHFVRRKANLVQGTWWIEYGGLKDTIQDAEHIRDELLRVVFGAFDWAKNHDPETREEAAYYKLTWVPTVAGKRESRRFVGDYILTQNDVESGRIFPDRVAFGGWPIDLHPAPGIYGKEIPPFTPFALKQPYSIPYRILYPKGVENLFMAGRHVSVTHVALGSTRLMQTIGTMGQAVGAAAFLCRKYQVGPRGLYPARMPELQQLLLKWDAYIPQVRNEDPGDLCRGARATASSSCPAVVVAPGGREPAMERDAPCTTVRGQSVMVADRGWRGIALYLCAAANTEAELRVERVVEEEKTEPLWTVRVPLASGGFRWVDFPLPDELTPGEEYRVWLSANPHLTWKIFAGSGGERY